MKNKEYYEQFVGQLIYNTSREGENFEDILFVITDLEKREGCYRYLVGQLFGPRPPLWYDVEHTLTNSYVIFLTGPKAGELPSWLTKKNSPLQTSEI